MFGNDAAVRTSRWHGLLPIDDSDRFDFYFDVLWEARHFDRRSGRGIFRKIFSVDLIHGCKFTHVLQKDRRLDDLLHRRSSLFDNRFEVRHHLTCLYFDIALHHLSGRWVDGHLSRCKQEWAFRDDSLTIGPDRCRCCRRRRPAAGRRSAPRAPPPPRPSTAVPPGAPAA